MRIMHYERIIYIKEVEITAFMNSLTIALAQRAGPHGCRPATLLPCADST